MVFVSGCHKKTEPRSLQVRKTLNRKNSFYLFRLIQEDKLTYFPLTVVVDGLINNEFVFFGIC